MWWWWRGVVGVWRGPGVQKWSWRVAARVFGVPRHQSQGPCGALERMASVWVLRCKQPQIITTGCGVCRDNSTAPPAVTSVTAGPCSLHLERSIPSRAPHAASLQHTSAPCAPVYQQRLATVQVRHCLRHLHHPRKSLRIAVHGPQSTRRPRSPCARGSSVVRPARWRRGRAAAGCC